jgi:hypothetical protein
VGGVEAASQGCISAETLTVNIRRELIGEIFTDT